MEEENVETKETPNPTGPVEGPETGPEEGPETGPEEGVDLEGEKLIGEEGPAPEPTEPEDPVSVLYRYWKDSEFVDDEHLGQTAQEKRDEFFRDVTDKESIQMCKLDDENPLTCMDHLVQLMGAGVIPSLASFGHVIQVYMDNLKTIQVEFCRAVRRGRVK